MNKKRKLLILLLLSLVFALGVAMLAACNRNVDPSQFVTDQGNTVKVQLDSIKSGVLDYRLKPGSPIPEPGVTAGTTAPVAEGYIFDGYYEGQKAADGSITYGNKWDFSKTVTEDLTLYGKWQIQYKIHINYVLDGQVQQQGEEVNITGNAARITSIKEPSWTGNTYIQTYLDAACTQELTVSSTQPFEHGCTQENPVCNVYAKFMQGRWTLIRNAVDLRTINAGSNLYLMNDIDMSTLVNTNGYTNITIAADFSGTIEGNGCKISNLNYYRKGTTGIDRETNYCVGLFARLINATIKNITFENCSVQGAVGQTSNEYFYGFMAGKADSCTFENITLDNCALQPLLFDVVGGLTTEQQAAEQEKIEQGVFVGDGSEYLPNIVGGTLPLTATNNAIVATVESIGKKFC